jgi:hypothetical protein
MMIMIALIDIPAAVVMPTLKFKSWIKGLVRS